MPIQPFRNSKPNHHPKCQCNLCDRKARAAVEAGRLRQLALEAGRVVAAHATEDRHARKAADAQASIDADVRATEIRRASMVDAEQKAKTDARAARFLELRAARVPAEQAFEQVEKEFSDVADV